MAMAALPHTAVMSSEWSLKHEEDEAHPRFRRGWRLTIHGAGCCRVTLGSTSGRTMIWVMERKTVRYHPMPGLGAVADVYHERCRIPAEPERDSSTIEAGDLTDWLVYAENAARPLGCIGMLMGDAAGFEVSFSTDFGEEGVIGATVRFTPLGRGACP